MLTFRALNMLKRCYWLLGKIENIRNIDRIDKDFQTMSRIN